MISRLEEIRRITVHIKQKYDGKRSVVYHTDKYPAKGDDFYYISVYEDAETHYAIIERYKVNILTKKIFRYNIITGEYVAYGSEK